VKIRALIFFQSILAVSCYSPGNELGESGGRLSYYDMDSLVTTQIVELMRLDPEVKKTAILDDGEEEEKFHLDSLGWEKELQVFRDANINKPAFLGFYDVTREVEDNYSNLVFDEYNSSGEGKFAVKNFKVYYLRKPQNIKKVVIVLNEQNELFKSERNLEMTFEEQGSNPLISSYNVNGSQKLKLKDPMSYEVKVELTF